MNDIDTRISEILHLQGREKDWREFNAKCLAKDMGKLDDFDFFVVQTRYKKLAGIVEKRKRKSNV